MKSNQPEVSIVIPCYNCEKWIEKCIGALSRQTRKDFEIICIDDSSTDDTGCILKRIKTSNTLDLTIITNDMNIGPAKSRNKAIKIARGKWIAFCDADDWYEPSFIEKMLAKANSTSSDIVMCEYRKVFESGKKSIDVRYLTGLPSNPTKEENIIYSKASLCLLLIKKELFGSLELPDLRNGEDIAIIPCLQGRAKIISTVKEPLYNYYIREQSASNNITSVGVYKSLNEAFIFIENNMQSDYKNVQEFLGIRIVLYGVVLNALKVNIDYKSIKLIIKNFEKKYPNWFQNYYFKVMPKTKKIFLLGVKNRLMIFCKAYAMLHSMIST